MFNNNWLIYKSLLLHLDNKLIHQPGDAYLISGKTNKWSFTLEELACQLRGMMSIDRVISEVSQ